MSEHLIGLRKKGGKTKHTKTFTFSTYQTADMGEDHEYRYAKCNPDNATISATMLTNYGNLDNLRIPWNVVKYWKYATISISPKISTNGYYKCNWGTGKKATSTYGADIVFDTSISNWSNYTVKADVSVYLSQT